MNFLGPPKDFLGPPKIQIGPPRTCYDLTWTSYDFQVNFLGSHFSHLGLGSSPHSESHCCVTSELPSWECLGIFAEKSWFYEHFVPWGA